MSKLLHRLEGVSSYGILSASGSEVTLVCQSLQLMLLDDSNLNTAHMRADEIDGRWIFWWLAIFPLQADRTVNDVSSTKAYKAWDNGAYSEFDWMMVYNGAFPTAMSRYANFSVCKYFWTMASGRQVNLQHFITTMLFELLWPNRVLFCMCTAVRESASGACEWGWCETAKMFQMHSFQMLRGCPTLRRNFAQQCFFGRHMTRYWFFRYKDFYLTSLTGDFTWMR